MAKKDKKINIEFEDLPEEDSAMKKSSSGKEMEIEELLDEIDLLRKEVEEYKKIEEECNNRIKRLQADYDNYRKRTLKEQLEHIKRANKDLMEKLLIVIDDFEKAIETAESGVEADQGFLKGFILIYSKLVDVLKKEGLEVIEPKGEEFDPNICEAVATESVEEVEEGTVLEILRKGYKINEHLLRPAVVKVCKK